MPIGLRSERYMVKVIHICQWWVARALVFFISHKVWIRLHRSTSRHLYNFSANIYVRTTRMQKQWMKPKLNIMSFVHGGCHLELPHKKALSGFLSGWVFDTSIIDNGVVI